MIFVHGNGVDHRLLLELDDVFADDGGYERIYLDLPGFGKTPALPGRGGLPDLAAWLDDVVDGLIGTTPFAVLGNSLGGLLACDLVSSRRALCLGMALLAPVVEPAREHRTLPEVGVVARDPALLLSLPPQDADAYAEMAAVQSEPGWERFRRAALPGIRAADEGAMRQLDALYRLPESPGDLLEGFDRPTLIVAGKQDTVVGFEDQWVLAKRFARSTYVALDLAGHNVHLDQPLAVRSLVNDWLHRMG